MTTQEQWQQLVAELATGIWRLRQRLLRGGAGREDAPRLRRDVESLWDKLRGAGVAVLDHTGEAYDPGKALKVVTFQPTPGLGREEVIETLKPTVCHGGRWLQMGEVIVGTPPGDPISS